MREHGGEDAGDGTLNTSPFGRDREPLHFPFLVLEAKSEKGPDTFGSTEIQTAFPIMTLLRLQADLLQTAGEHSAWPGPLVWFFSNKGEQWRVAVGVVETADNARQYVRFSIHVPRHIAYLETARYPAMAWDDHVSPRLASTSTYC